MTKLAVGQRFRHIFELAPFAPDEHITLQTGRFAVTYAVRPAGAATRLHVRVLFGGPGALRWGLTLGDVVTMRKQLLTLRGLAERKAATASS